MYDAVEVALPRVGFVCFLIYYPVKQCVFHRSFLLHCDLCPRYRCPVLPDMRAFRECSPLSYHHTSGALLHARRLLLVTAAAAVRGVRLELYPVSHLEDNSCHDFT